MRLPRFATLCATAFLLAACQIGNPNPEAATDTPAQMRSGLQEACMATQSRIQSLPKARFSSSCGCYARRTIRALDDGELAAFRDNGVFNASARGKALASLDRCGLKRP
jgi:hypothetical protein